jgi:hypothetical protein
MNGYRHLIIATMVLTSFAVLSIITLTALGIDVVGF